MPAELLLPLFPLEVVLLPSATLPLHIFETRYKLMIGEAIQNHSEFGIVLAKDSSLVNVGCTATVEKVIRRYDDGRMDIVTAGRRRFEILFLDEQKPYLQAAVHFFEDDPDTAPAPPAAQRLAELYENVLRFLSQTGAPAPEAGVTTFQAGGCLPLDLEVKQRLLTSRSEAERVTILNEYLEKLLPRLKLAQRAERSARGNGHGR
ncbi:MAG TPA: LON peptidase substrate-binding domain-containing protein [Bryobacterales bacterium]|nr:LON peptidase substrate-binding domain-containing protein [Bryobacterales bacterium]